MAPGLWTAVPGSILLDLYETGRLAGDLPRSAAIYMWKRSLRIPDDRAMTPESFVSWLDEVSTAALGQTRHVRLNHYLKAEAIELAGAPLPPDKANALAAFVRHPRNRRWLEHYLEQLAPHAPALYAGETTNLVARVGQHIAGESDFGGIVYSTTGLDWASLDLHYADLGTATEGSTDIRKALEYLTTMVTIAGHTHRPG